MNKVRLEFPYSRTEGGLRGAAHEDRLPPEDGELGIVTVRVPIPSADWDGTYSILDGLNQAVRSVGIGVLLRYSSIQGWQVLKPDGAYPTTCFVALEEQPGQEFTARIVEHAQLVFTQALQAKEANASLLTLPEEESEKTDDSYLDDIPF